MNKNHLFIIFTLSLSLSYNFLINNSIASMEKDVADMGYNFGRTSPLTYEQIDQMIKRLNKLEVNDYVKEIPQMKKDFELFILTQKSKCLQSKITSPQLTKSCFDKIRESTYAFIEASYESRKKYFESVMADNMKELEENKELIKKNYKNKLGEK